MPVTPEQRIEALDRLSNGRSKSRSFILFAEPLELPEGQSSRSALFEIKHTFITEQEDYEIGYRSSILVKIEFLRTQHLNENPDARPLMIIASVRLEAEHDLQYVTFMAPDQSQPGGYSRDRARSEERAERLGVEFDPLRYAKHSDLFDAAILEGVRGQKFDINRGSGRGR